MAKKITTTQDEIKPVEPIAKPADTVVLVQMVRGENEKADVHPLEVENYKLGGWVLAGKK